MQEKDKLSAKSHDSPVSEPGFIRRADFSGQIPPTPQGELEAAIQELNDHKDEWAKLGLPKRIRILNQILEDLWSVKKRWVSLSVEAKGTNANAYAQAEEWVFVTCIFRMVRLLGKSLRQIQKFGRPRIPGPITIRPGGQVVA